MKKNILLICCIAFLNKMSIAQSVGIGTASPNTAAVLDITSNSKGVLIPRLTKTQRTSMPAVQGMLVYDAEDSIFYCNDGIQWRKLIDVTTGTAWFTNGNGNSNTATHFIGTTDKVALKFVVNNQRAGFIDTSGSVSFGRAALQNNPGTKINVAFGDSALYRNGFGAAAGTEATGNTGIGNKALKENTTGYTNTAFGNNALQNNTVGASNTATGAGALKINTTGFSNTATGTEALFSNTSGFYNTANGNQAMYFNTTGNFNTAAGNTALYSNSTGSFNTASGVSALFSNTTGNSNTAIGYTALGVNTTGYNNTAHGSESLYGNTTGFQNTATGFRSLYNNTTGFWNTAAGWQSLTTNSTGVANTGLGYEALNYATTANYNTGVGHQALLFTTTGTANTTLGAFAGSVNTTGTNNIAVGYNANFAANNLTNATVIGYNAVVNTSNSMVLGNNVKVGIGTSSPLSALSVKRFAGVDATATFQGTEFATQIHVDNVTENVLIQAGKSGNSVILNPIPSGQIYIGGNGQNSRTELYGKVFANEVGGVMTSGLNIIPLGVVEFHAWEDDDYGILGSAEASYANLVGNLATSVNAFGASNITTADNLGCVINLNPAVMTGYSNYFIMGNLGFDGGRTLPTRAYAVSNELLLNPPTGSNPNYRVTANFSVDDFPNLGRCHIRGTVMVYGIR